MILPTMLPNSKTFSRISNQIRLIYTTRECLSIKTSWQQVMFFYAMILYASRCNHLIMGHIRFSSRISPLQSKERTKLFLLIDWNQHTLTIQILTIVNQLIVPNPPLHLPLHPVISPSPSRVTRFGRHARFPNRLDMWPFLSSLGGGSTVVVCPLYFPISLLRLLSYSIASRSRLFVILSQLFSQT